MLDSQLLRNSIEQVSTALSKRDMKLDVDVIQKLEEKRKTFQIKAEELQALRNSKSIKPNASPKSTWSLGWKS